MNSKVLELSKVLSGNFKNGVERWFVDEKQGKSMVNIFNSNSKDECILFMGKYRKEVSK